MERIMERIRKKIRKRVTCKRMQKPYIQQKDLRLRGKYQLLSLAAAGALLLAGCAKDQSARDTGLQLDESQNRQGREADTEQGRETVSLQVWGALEDTELMEQVLLQFQQQYQDQADFQITYQEQGESGCKDALLAGPQEGADVFAFADDQLQALAAAGVLEPLEDAEVIRTEHLPKAVEAASVADTVYAYPLTADNGYFMYYNKEFFSEEDIISLERMLEIAADNGKYLAMDWSSAWYVYAFFGNTGMQAGLNADGITNFCTWNDKEGKIKGVDVARSMLQIAKSPGFSNRTDAEFLQGVQDGTVIAGVSGVWNAVAIEEAWGADYGAAKLPAFTCAGQQVQMASFSGCKLIGVNAYSQNRKWAAKLAEWIVSEENQTLRFEMRGQGPSNRQAAASGQVQESPAISALLAQSEYSHLQRVGGKFWEPVETFAGNMALGNATGEDLQKQLDQMAEQVTAR